MLALALPSISKELQLSSVSAGALEHVHAARHGHRRRAGRLARRSHRTRPRRVVGGPHLLDVHGRHRAVRHLLADRGDALRLGIRHRRAVQHRHAARGRIRPDAHADDRARHAAGRLVGRLRDRGAALRLPAAAVRLAAALCVRDRARHRRAGAPVEGARPAELDRAAARRRASRAAAQPVRARSGPIRPLRRTFLLWTRRVDRAAVRLLRRELVAAQLSREGSRRQRAEHGLVRRRHVHDDGGRQDRHRLSRRHRRAARRCGSCRAC